MPKITEWINAHRSERWRSFPEQFGMGAKAGEKDVLGLWVLPNQEEIALDVAFQITVPISRKGVRTIAGRNGTRISKLVQDILQRSKLSRLVLITFQVLLELASLNQVPHIKAPLRIRQNGQGPAAPSRHRIQYP